MQGSRLQASHSHVITSWDTAEKFMVGQHPYKLWDIWDTAQITTMVHEIASETVKCVTLRHHKRSKGRFMLVNFMH